jgi:hypothetical protein
MLKDPVRSWVDRDAALAQLKDEGWTITGLHPNRLPMKQDSRQRICGCATMRTVQQDFRNSIRALIFALLWPLEIFFETLKRQERLIFRNAIGSFPPA